MADRLETIEVAVKISGAKTGTLYELVLNFPEYIRIRSRAETSNLYEYIVNKLISLVSTTIASNETKVYNHNRLESSLPNDVLHIEQKAEKFINKILSRVSGCWGMFNEFWNTFQAMTELHS